MSASPPDSVPFPLGMLDVQAVDHKKDKCFEIKGVPPGFVRIFSPPQNSKVFYLDAYTK
jgi:hypothetical protein